MSAHCRVCAQPLPDGARKCTVCGEYQSFVARFLGGLDLQALVALVPIATLAYAFLQDRLVAKHSDLRVALVGCASEAVTVFASNVGNRPAIITEALYRVSGAEERPLGITVESADQRLIKGGEARPLVLTVDLVKSPGGLVPFNQRGPACQVDVTIRSVAFDHTPTPLSVTCDCPG